MEDFLQQEFLNNTVESYLWVLGVILLALLIRRVISKYLAGQILGAIVHRKTSPQKQLFLQLVIKPMENFLLVFVAVMMLDRLNFPKFLQVKIYHVNTDDIVHAFGWILIIIVFIRFCMRVLDFFGQMLEEKRNEEEDFSGRQLIVFFKDFFKVILVIIGGLLMLRFAFNKNIGSLLTSLSLVGAAIALATRESLENLIASFIIFFDKPFITGDLVKVQNLTGTIEKIGLRSTRIRTESKTYISVPNKQMVDTIVDNITLRTQRKVELRLELSLSTTSEQLKQFIGSLKNVLQKKSAIENYNVYLSDTGRNAHIIAADYFTVIPQAIEDFNSLKEEVNLEAIELLSKYGIELAAANTDVIVRQK